jgi:L-asparaginase
VPPIRWGIIVAGEAGTRRKRPRRRQRPRSRRSGSSRRAARSPNKDGGRLTAEHLVALIPGVESLCKAGVRAVLQYGQQRADAQEWLELSRRINTLFKEDSDLAGIVVTSGTDTLEETAYFLDLTVRTDKPVVVVGSMRNPSTLGYEGAATCSKRSAPRPSRRRAARGCSSY